MSKTAHANIRRYFLSFMLYSFIGWAYEVFLEVVVYRWGYSDRGVLTGPYCPVYGVGALVFLICLSPLMRMKLAGFKRYLRVLAVFLLCMLIATGIELAASYILEAATGSWPWQTYADYAINFEARIALSPSVRFGLGGLLFLYVVQPLFDRLFAALGEKTCSRCAWVLAVLFALDCAAFAVKTFL